MQHNIIDEAKSLRRYLHQHPELSCFEENTSRHLIERLKSDCSPDELIVFKHYGIAAIFRGKEPGKNVLIRGDFDALPIQEINDFEHKSRNEGVSHKCGHDGHASILYALARQLSLERPERGDAILLFQPAEENGAGAKGIINDPLFESIKPDYAVALHNLPGYDLHTVVWRSGTFTAAANSIVIKLNGKTSHAAEPELGINPALAMAEITQLILKENQPDLNADDFRIATPIYTTMGDQAYGVSAGYGELHFTLRAWENQVIREHEKKCERIARQVAGAHKLEIQIEWTQSFFANFNHERVITAIKGAAVAGGLKTEQRATPFKWGEDFGIFTERFPGAMFGIGSGKDCPALHNPDYDFPDELIQTGMIIFREIISQLQD
ncbi:MAG: amidohydrolase [Marinoscillum sp.]|uniref:amidohydrolase n=1 Tax=Marinoscillum sp. TaxID=2024838 RepID=UPI0032F206E3